MNRMVRVLAPLLVVAVVVAWLGLPETSAAYNIATPNGGNRVAVSVNPPPRNFTATPQSILVVCRTTLAWQPPVFGLQTGYEIRRTNGLGTVKNLGTFGPGVTSHIDEIGLTLLIAPYTYEIRALYGGGPPSNWVSRTHTLIGVCI